MLLKGPKLKQLLKKQVFPFLSLKFYWTSACLVFNFQWMYVECIYKTKIFLLPKLNTYEYKHVRYFTANNFKRFPIDDNTLFAMYYPGTRNPPTHETYCCCFFFAAQQFHIHKITLLWNLLKKDNGKKDNSL